MERVGTDPQLPKKMKQKGRFFQISVTPHQFKTIIHLLWTSIPKKCNPSKRTRLIEDDCEAGRRVNIKIEVLTNAYGEGGWVDLKFIIAYECIWCTWIGGIQNLESLRKFIGGGGVRGFGKFFSLRVMWTTPSVLTEVSPKPTQTILKGSCSPKFLKYQPDTQFYSLCEGSSFKNIKQLLLKVSAL